MKSVFYLTHLYPNEMAIYGDMGNVLALIYRLEKRNFKVIYQPVSQAQELPVYSDFYFMGGGQDKEQEQIYQDFLSKKEKLLNDLELGVPMLAICGAYQLLGESFLTGSGQELQGLGWFDVQTKAPSDAVRDRCIGNVVVKSDLPELENDLLIGFENHGGQTYFTSQKRCKPLGQVLVGNGNNSVEKLEGCVRGNTIGSYLHGSCLPKNPALADWLLKKALITRQNRGESSIEWVQSIDDKIELTLRTKLLERFLK